MARGTVHRKPTNVSARPELIAEAKALGITLSSTLSSVSEQAVAQAVADAKRQRWIEGSQPAFDAYDAYVETHGGFGNGKRMF